MKKLVVSKENPCKACLSCVRACSEAFYKTFDPDLSCIRITAKADGEPKVMSCIMCGKCARTCPEGAISQNAKGVYMIDKKKCVGCGKCVEACPHACNGHGPRRRQAQQVHRLRHLRQGLPHGHPLRGGEVSVHHRIRRAAHSPA